MTLKDFFENNILYQNFVLVENYSDGNEKFYNPIEFNGTTYQVYCENEKDYRTFEIEIENKQKHITQKQNTFIDEIYLQDDKINYTFMCTGKCKSCNKFKITYVINVYSDKKVPRELVTFSMRPGTQPRKKLFEEDTTVYGQIVGCIPPSKPMTDNRITKFFDRESNNWYFKGLDLLSKGYGIGSYSYFRRIIEKELINIIEDLKKLPDSDVIAIGKLLADYREHPKTHTIYENIFAYLPASLQNLGVNPIKLLYNLTSGGLHSDTEEDCLNNAQNIAKLLSYTIIKISEEKSDLKDMRDVIKNLTTKRAD